MPQPFDYSIPLPDPSAGFLNGLQQGMGLQNAAAQQQQQQMQSSMIAELLKNPTAEGYSRMMTAFPKAAEAYGKAWSVLNTEQQQTLLSDLSQWSAAMAQGKPQIASQLMRARADAYDSTAGKSTQEGSMLRAKADLVDKDPDMALNVIALPLIAAHPQGKQLIDNILALRKEARDQQLHPPALAEAKAKAGKAEAEERLKWGEVFNQPTDTALKNENMRSQIEERAARLGLDRDRITSDTQIRISELNQKFGQLPDDARKIVNDSALNAVASESLTNQYQRLAGQLEQQVAGGTGYGASSSASEWLKSVTGNQDALTGLRQEYTRLMGHGVMKMLPPGPASDKDVALAREGFPKANADAGYLASFLRGMAKISAYDAVLNNAKSEWAGAVQHLGRAKSDIEIDGVKVPAGTTFNEFARKYLAQRADQLNSAAVVGTRGYMRFATPQTGGATGGY